MRTVLYVHRLGRLTHKSARRRAFSKESPRVFLRLSSGADLGIELVVKLTTVLFSGPDSDSAVDRGSRAIPVPTTAIILTAVLVDGCRRSTPNEGEGENRNDDNKELVHGIFLSFEKPVLCG